MREAASVLMPEAALRYTLPPWPPSPPSGPPNGTNFSRRKLVLPRPPLPACTRSRASSTNFMMRLYCICRTLPPQTKAPARGRGLRETKRAARSRSGLRRQHAHVQALLGAALAKLHRPGHFREQRVIGAGSDVAARAHLRAPLGHDDVAGEDVLAAEALDAETLGVRIAAVLGTAARLFMSHDSPTPCSCSLPHHPALISVTLTSVNGCR